MNRPPAPRDATGVRWALLERPLRPGDPGYVPVGTSKRGCPKTPPHRGLKWLCTLDAGHPGRCVAHRLGGGESLIFAVEEEGE